MTATTQEIGIFHPSTKFYRFTLLIFVAGLSLGSYFAYDIVASLSETLGEQLDISMATVGSFFSFYHIAAIVLVLFGGIFTDKIGTRKASLIFSILILIGVVLFWTAKSIPMFFVGRFIFGAGSEPLIVAQSAILARWFKNKELALSFGIALMVSRLGSLFAFNTGQVFTNFFGTFRAALFAAVIACVISLIANIIYVFMDKKGEKVLDLRKEGIEEKIVFKDIKKFKPSFWYVTFLCVTFYSAIFPFLALAPAFFSEKWGVAAVAVSSGSFLAQVFNNFTHIFNTGPGIASIIITASMILAPFAGKLVDKFGKRATWMIFGSLIMIPSHALMGLTKIWPVFPMIALGAAFVLVPAAMWPSVPLIVRKERVGTAFGVMTAVQNVGLSIFPLLNGFLRDITKSYTASMLMFASLGFVGLIFALLLKRADAREGGGLE
jgi:MFS family permease